MPRAPATRLSLLIKWRDQYIKRTNGLTDHKIPYGAPVEQWLAWRRWVDARRAKYAEAIAVARAEKRFNQRSKADERKRNARAGDPTAHGSGA